jgi:hypothetical protein
MESTALYLLNETTKSRIFLIQDALKVLSKGLCEVGRGQRAQQSRGVGELGDLSFR